MNLIRPNAIDIFTGLVSTFEFFVRFSLNNLIFTKIYAVIKRFIPTKFREALFAEEEPELNNLSKIKDEEPRMIALENLHDLYLYHSNRY